MRSSLKKVLLYPRSTQPSFLAILSCEKGQNANILFRDAPFKQWQQINKQNRQTSRVFEGRFSLCILESKMKGNLQSTIFSIYYMYMYIFFLGQRRNGGKYENGKIFIYVYFLLGISILRRRRNGNRETRLAMRK